MEKISKETIDRFNEISKEQNKILSLFEKRINYVIQCIVKEFGLEMKDWEFWVNDSCDDPNDHDPLSSWFYKIQKRNMFQIDELEINLTDKSWFKKQHAFWFDDECYDWSQERSFPSKWITNDFEEELKVGHQEHLQNLEEEKNQELEEKLKRTKVKSEALNKLTDEEKKSLGIMENK